MTVLVSGTTKHSITLTAQDGHEPLLKDLCDALTEATGVPAPSQKVIFKGKTAHSYYALGTCVSQLPVLHYSTVNGLCFGYKRQ